MAKPVTPHQNQIIIGARDFSAELQAAREAQDWVAHAQIWEDRRCANVESDEAMLRRFEIGTPVFYKGKAANVTGRDNGTEEAIIEFCDPKDGAFKTARDADLVIDQASVDEEAAFQEYQTSQSDPALIASELHADIGRPAHCPEAYEEMARHDAEGRS